MHPSLIQFFAFAGTAIFIGTLGSLVYDALVTYPASVRQRLREAAGKAPDGKSTALLNLKQLADSAAARPKLSAWAAELVEQSGVALSLRLVLLTSLAMAMALAIAAGLILHAWWCAAIGFTAGLGMPWGYVISKRRGRIRRLTQQLPDALDVMCRAIRAGQTVPASFQMIADDFAPPIADEFRHCYEQQNLGISYDAALRNLARRTGIMELRILVIALLVQSRSGGNLIDLMHNLSTMVRKRLVLQQKVKALTGEGRMQAAVLIALPLLVFVAMYFLNREYAQVLLDRPWLLAGCGAAQAVGAVVIHKMIQIDY